MSTKTVVDRFWEKVTKAGFGGCWVWTGHTNIQGYGIIKNNKKHVRAHRFSYEIHCGEIPVGLFVCHRCDNPPCVNPAHLWLGTARDNNRDARLKGRAWSPVLRGELHPRAKLTFEQAKEIRVLNGSISGIARKYGVSRRTVGKIKADQLWCHADG